MEWPIHQLLRQQCESPEDEETGSVCSTSVCSTSVTFTPKDISIHPKKGLEKRCSTSSDTCSDCTFNPKHMLAEPREGLSEPVTPPKVKHKHGRKAWRRRCMTYGRLDGWYVLTAELLGTIILIALCVVAASQV